MYILGLGFEKLHIFVKFILVILSCNSFILYELEETLQVIRGCTMYLFYSLMLYVYHIVPESSAIKQL